MGAEFLQLHCINSNSFPAYAAGRCCPVAAFLGLQGVESSDRAGTVPGWHSGPACTQTQSQAAQAVGNIFCRFLVSSRGREGRKDTGRCRRGSRYGWTGRRGRAQGYNEEVGEMTREWKGEWVYEIPTHPGLSLFKALPQRVGTRPEQRGWMSKCFHKEYSVINQRKGQKRGKEQTVGELFLFRVNDYVSWVITHRGGGVLGRTIQLEKKECSNCNHWTKVRAKV